MNLKQLNELSQQQAQQTFINCCSSQRWVEKMVSARPFESIASLQNVADDNWTNLSEEDFLQAFEGHPKIGDINSLKQKYASTQSIASGEQSLVADASETVIKELSQCNQDYREKFGFIFIVCATGKSADQMLDLLKQRLPNSRAIEIQNAAEEQRKIFQIRIKKQLEIE